MLDTFQLIERLANLRIQQGGTPAERKIYDNAVSALMQEWKRYLADSYAHEFTHAQQEAIFTAAESEDAGNYLVTEQQYDRYAAFARNFVPKPE